MNTWVFESLRGSEAWPVMTLWSKISPFTDPEAIAVSFQLNVRQDTISLWSYHKQNTTHSNHVHFHAKKQQRAKLLNGDAWYRGYLSLNFSLFGSLTKLLGRCTTAKLCGWTFCMLLQFVLDCLPSRFIHNCSAEWPEKMLGTIWQSDIRCCIYFETKKKMV